MSLCFLCFSAHVCYCSWHLWLISVLNEPLPPDCISVCPSKVLVDLDWYWPIFAQLVCFFFAFKRTQKLRMKKWAFPAPCIVWKLNHILDGDTGQKWEQGLDLFIVSTAVTALQGKLRHLARAAAAASGAGQWWSRDGMRTFLEPTAMPKPNRSFSATPNPVERRESLLLNIITKTSFLDSQDVSYLSLFKGLWKLES